MTNKDKKLNPLIVLVGPTASGKTEVAMAMAKKIGAEIISADSRQVYKGMDIGTAKPRGRWKKSKTVRQFLVKDIFHHMIDVVRPDEEFDAGKYKEQTDKIIKEIYARGHLPLLAGGTGLYVKAVVDGLCPSPPVDKKLREKLQKMAAKYGKMYLYRRLKKIDPGSAARIHPQNLVKILRALEVYDSSRIPLSAYQKMTAKPDHKTVMIGLQWERSALYKRIEDRVDKMLASGLVSEVRRLLRKGYDEKLYSLQGVGYKQIAGYLKGHYDLKEAERLLKRDTRRYAKRQLTWFRKDRRIHWIKVGKKFNVKQVADRGVQLLRKKKLF
jgi:tRNA dimethylallyltransferase